MTEMTPIGDKSAASKGQPAALPPPSRAPAPPNGVAAAPHRQRHTVDAWKRPEHACPSRKEIQCGLRLHARYSGRQTLSQVAEGRCKDPCALFADRVRCASLSSCSLFYEMESMNLHQQLWVPGHDGRRTLHRLSNAPPAWVRHDRMAWQRDLMRVLLSHVKCHHHFCSIPVRKKCALCIFNIF